ncbi:anti-sigma factor [Ekhidna sp.]|uniref:anti-sigma factor family protein n=1 Tax=Ekhidna sp. TaxID=2608089 RepID=UPI003514711C
MSYKPDEAILADYLAGELTKEEQAKVESYLTEHPEMKKELEEIQALQQMMGKVEDKEVVAPSFVFEEPPAVVITKQRSTDRLIKSTLAVAASITLLLVAGYFTQFSITNGDNGLQVSFSAPPTSSNPAYTEADIKSWMQQAMTQNNSDLVAQINAVKNELGETDLNKLASQPATSGTIDRELLNQYINELRLANRDIIQGLLQDTERSQQEYLTRVMTDFADFMELQRQKDLDAIQLQFTSLANGNEGAELDSYLNSE